MLFIYFVREPFSPNSLPESFFALIDRTILRKETEKGKQPNHPRKNKIMIFYVDFLSIEFEEIGNKKVILPRAVARELEWGVSSPLNGSQ